MGIIRGGLFVIVSVLLFVSLLAGNLFWTLSSSLQYDNVQPELASVVGGIVGSQADVNNILDENFQLMEEYCEDYSEFVFDEGGYSFVIQCDKVSQGSDAVINNAVDSLVDGFYYKNYDCDFWACFGEADTPLFLISEKARDYWNGMFYFSLVGSFVLIVLMFFLIEKKTNLLLVAGALIIVSSLIFVKLDSLMEIIMGPIISSMEVPGGMSSYFSSMISIFFNKSNAIFLRVFISGIVVLGVGILLKIFHIGFAISNLFSKSQKEGVKKSKKISKDEVKQIVKTEVSKKIKDKKSK